jgi:hypothetical protein
VFVGAAAAAAASIMMQSPRTTKSTYVPGPNDRVINLLDSDDEFDVLDTGDFYRDGSAPVAVQRQRHASVPTATVLEQLQLLGDNSSSDDDNSDGTETYNTTNSSQVKVRTRKMSKRRASNRRQLPGEISSESLSRILTDTPHSPKVTTRSTIHTTAASASSSSSSSSSPSSGVASPSSSGDVAATLSLSSSGGRSSGRASSSAPPMATRKNSISMATTSISPPSSPLMQPTAGPPPSIVTAPQRVKERKSVGESSPKPRATALADKYRRSKGALAAATISHLDTSKIVRPATTNAKASRNSHRLKKNLQLLVRGVGVEQAAGDLVISEPCGGYSVADKTWREVCFAHERQTHTHREREREREYIND